jgi:hypothetical protein
MAILKGKGDARSDSDCIPNRVFPPTVKLTKEEWGRVTEFARSKGLAPGEWIREVILREVCGASASDPSLAEILGVRLLLVNVLHSGCRPEARAGSVRQTARPNQRREAPARSQLGYCLCKEIGDSRRHLGLTKTRAVYLTACGKSTYRQEQRARPGNEYESLPAPDDGSIAQSSRVSRPQPLTRCLRQP